jgi:hypothetical protein
MVDHNKDDAKQRTPAPLTGAWSRRLKYGFNVTVAVLAAVVVVGLLNALAYKFFWRVDVTALRQHSLAPQTRKVLDSLAGEYRLVTLMSTPDAVEYPDQADAVRQARDLVDEYARLSGQVTAQHLEPGRDLSAIETFFAGLQARYAKELEPTQQAIERGRQAMANLRGETQGQIKVLQALVKEPALTDEALRQSVTTVLQSLMRFEQQYDNIADTIKTILADTMPDYASAQAAVAQVLGEMKEKIIERAIVSFKTAAGQGNVDAAVKELLLEAATLLDRSLQAVSDGLKALQAQAGSAEYAQLRSQLQSPAGSGVQSGVVVVGPTRVQVVPLVDMFRAPPANLVAAGERPERQFLGEERITGALLSMSMDRPPLVVFVTSSARVPVLGPNGLFEHVAQRLRHLNFEVRTWNPAGQMTSFGQPLPAGPAPLPQEGQRAVYIILPQLEPPNPMNPSGMQDQAKVAQLLEDRLDAGDGALVMLSFDLGSRFGAANPVRDVVAQWGITPQLDRVIVREVMLPESKTTVDTKFLVHDWPSDLPVTQALRGMSAWFVQVSPLTISPSDPAGAQGGLAIERFPLLRLREPRMWATGEVESEQPPQYDAATAAESFLIGAAARRGSAALIVIADPVWASDYITTISTIGAKGEDEVNLFGAQFPGNGELFVNSVYWLAGLEELIAASPRSQDIRRIEPISDVADQVLRIALLAGLPAAALLAGVIVWMIRRRV